MGILKKRKYQAGGSLFGDSRFIDFTPDIPVQQYPGGQGVRGTGSSKVDSSGKKEKDVDADKKNLLLSDIAWYEGRVNQLKGEIEAGINKDSNYAQTPEFAKKSKELYDLTEVNYSAMFDMAKRYNADATNYRNVSSKAGDEPAIIGGKAIVLLNTEDRSQNPQFAVVSVKELLTNPNNYAKVINGRDAVELRQKDPRFSGFTDAGRIIDTMLTRAYGNKAFNDEIQDLAGSAGVIQNGDDFFINNNPMGIKDILPETDGLVSSNAVGLQYLSDQLLRKETNLSEYLVNSSIDMMFNKAKNGEIKPEDLQNDSKRNELLQRSMNTMLHTALMTKIGEHVTEKSKTSSESGSDKIVKMSNFKLAEMTIFNSTERVEVSNLKAHDPSAADIIHEFPASKIQGGFDYFDKNAYVEGTVFKGDDDKEASSTNRKTIANNTKLNDVVGGLENLTTLDGTRLLDLVDTNLHHAIIPSNTQFSLILAPTEMRDGKPVVNFKSEYIPQMYEAAKIAYAKLKEEGYSPEDVLKGGEEMRKKFEEISMKAFEGIVNKEGLKEAPTMKLALTFKVQYDATSDTYYDPVSDRYPDKPGAENVKHIWVPSDNGKELFNTIDEHGNYVFGWGAHPQETMAFGVIDQGFWGRTQMDDAFASEYQYSTTKGKQTDALASKNQMGTFSAKSVFDNVAIQEYLNSNKPVKKLHGGKLLSAQEIGDLLFK